MAQEDKESDNGIFEVERIIGRRVSLIKGVEYFIFWKDYTVADCTWEPATNIIDAATIRDFERACSQIRFDAIAHRENEIVVGIQNKMDRYENEGIATLIDESLDVYPLDRSPFENMMGGEQDFLFTQNIFGDNDSASSSTTTTNKKGKRGSTKNRVRTRPVKMATLGWHRQLPGQSYRIPEFLPRPSLSLKQLAIKDQHPIVKTKIRGVIKDYGDRIYYLTQWSDNALTWESSRAFDDSLDLLTRYEHMAFARKRKELAKHMRNRRENGLVAFKDLPSEPRFMVEVVADKRNTLDHHYASSDSESPFTISISNKSRIHPPPSPKPIPASSSSPKKDNGEAWFNLSSSTLLPKKKQNPPPPMPTTVRNRKSKSTHYVVDFSNDDDDDVEELTLISSTLPVTTKREPKVSSARSSSPDLPLMNDLSASSSVYKPRHSLASSSSSSAAAASAAASSASLSTPYTYFDDDNNDNSSICSSPEAPADITSRNRSRRVSDNDVNNVANVNERKLVKKLQSAKRQKQQQQQQQQPDRQVTMSNPALGQTTQGTRKRLLQRGRGSGSSSRGPARPRKSVSANNSPPSSSLANSKTTTPQPPSAPTFTPPTIETQPNGKSNGHADTWNNYDSDETIEESCGVVTSALSKKIPKKVSAAKPKPPLSAPVSKQPTNTKPTQTSSPPIPTYAACSFCTGRTKTLPATPSMSSAASWTCEECQMCYHSECYRRLIKRFNFDEVYLETLEDMDEDDEFVCKFCSLHSRRSVERFLTWRHASPGNSMAVPHGNARQNLNGVDVIVKWKGVAYKHLDWVPYLWLRTTVTSSKEFATFKLKVESACAPPPVLESVFDQKYLQPAAILDAKRSQDPNDISQRENSLDVEADLALPKDMWTMYTRFDLLLVQWCGLDMSEATWESPPDPRQSVSEYSKWYTQFMQWYSAENVSFNGHVAATSVQKKRLRPGAKGSNAVINRKPAEMATVNTSITSQPSYIRGGRLFDFQLNAISQLSYWWNTGKSGVLAYEPGMGKRVQAVAFLSFIFHSMLPKPDSPVLNQQAFPFLVVVPMSKINGWLSAFKEWAPDMVVGELSGRPMERKIQLKYKLFRQLSDDDGGGSTASAFGEGSQRPRRDLKCHVVLASYDAMSHQDDLPEFYEEGGIWWQAIVYDWGDRFIGNGTKMYKMMSSYSSRMRLVLTNGLNGKTPRQLLGILSLADPSNVHSLSHMKEDLVHDSDIRLSSSDLQDILRAQMIQRTKHDGNGLSIPPKYELIVPVSMSKMQRDLFRIKVAGHGSSPKSVEASLSSAFKVFNHPYLLKGVTDKCQGLSVAERHKHLTRASGKLRFLHLLLHELKRRRHKSVIVSRCKAMLDILEAYLLTEGYLYGRLDDDMPACMMQKCVCDFNAPDSRQSILLSYVCKDYKSTSADPLNLTTASFVIFFDSDILYTNSSDVEDDRVVGRVSRFGQVKPVTVLRLINDDTLEERLVKTICSEKREGKDSKSFLSLLASIKEHELRREAELVQQPGFDSTAETRMIHYDQERVRSLLDDCQYSLENEGEESIDAGSGGIRAINHRGVVESLNGYAEQQRRFLCSDWAKSAPPGRRYSHHTSNNNRNSSISTEASLPPPAADNMYQQQPQRQRYRYTRHHQLPHHDWRTSVSTASKSPLPVPSIRRSSRSRSPPSRLSAEPQPAPSSRANQPGVTLVPSSAIIAKQQRQTSLPPAGRQGRPSVYENEDGIIEIQPNELLQIVNMRVNDTLQLYIDEAKARQLAVTPELVAKVSLQFKALAELCQSMKGGNPARLSLPPLFFPIPVNICLPKGVPLPDQQQVLQGKRCFACGIPSHERSYCHCICDTRFKDIITKQVKASDKLYWITPIYHEFLRWYTVQYLWFILSHPTGRSVNMAHTLGSPSSVYAGSASEYVERIRCKLPAAAASLTPEQAKKRHDLIRMEIRKRVQSESLPSIARNNFFAPLGKDSQSGAQQLIDIYGGASEKVSTSRKPGVWRKNEEKHADFMAIFQKNIDKAELADLETETDVAALKRSIQYLRSHRNKAVCRLRSQIDKKRVAKGTLDPAIQKGDSATKAPVAWSALNSMAFGLGHISYWEIKYWKRISFVKKQLKKKEKELSTPPVPAVTVVSAPAVVETNNASAPRTSPSVDPGVAISSTEALSTQLASAIEEPTTTVPPPPLVAVDQRSDLVQLKSAFVKMLRVQNLLKQGSLLATTNGATNNSSSAAIVKKLYHHISIGLLTVVGVLQNAATNTESLKQLNTIMEKISNECYASDINHGRLKDAILDAFRWTSKNICKISRVEPSADGSDVKIRLEDVVRNPGVTPIMPVPTSSETISSEGRESSSTPQSVPGTAVVSATQSPKASDNALGIIHQQQTASNAQPAYPPVIISTPSSSSMVPLSAMHVMPPSTMQLQQITGGGVLSAPVTATTTTAGPPPVSYFANSMNYSPATYVSQPQQPQQQQQQHNVAQQRAMQYSQMLSHMAAVSQADKLQRLPQAPVYFAVNQDNSVRYGVHICPICQSEGVHVADNCPYRRDISMLTRRRVLVETNQQVLGGIKQEYLNVLDRYIAQAITQQQGLY